jgi:hypothetical protein
MRAIITCLLFVAASLSVHAQQKVIYDAHAEKRPVSAFMQSEFHKVLPSY